MAIGFTPKHTEEVQLPEFTPEQFLVLAVETVKDLNWQINYLSKSGLIAYTNKGMFSFNAEVKIVLKDDGMIGITSASTGNEMIDFGKNKKTIRDFWLAFEVARLTFKSDELDKKYDELFAQIDPQGEDFLTLPPQTAVEQIKDFLSIFIPQKEFFITPILVNLNLIIYIIMVFTGMHFLNPSSEDLIKWGANFRPYTLNDEPWRLLTNCFLHIGVIHLVMNMFALFYIGALLEPILGRSRFLAAYFITGFIASVTSMCWHDLSVSAGASGAIFGMYGVFLALLTTDLIEKNARKSLLTSIAIFVGYNLIYGLKGNIDNAAHIGGLVSGFLIGYAFLPSIKRELEPGIKHITIAFLTFFTVAITSGIYWRLPNNHITNQEVMNGVSAEKNTQLAADYDIKSDHDRREYDAIMKEFISIESMALDIYPLDSTAAGKEQSLSQIKDRGIYYWKRNLEILETLKPLKLPSGILKRNKLLEEYCYMYLEFYNLLYKSYDEHTDRYNEQLKVADQKIKAQVNKMRETYAK